MLRTSACCNHPTRARCVCLSLSLAIDSYPRSHFVVVTLSLPPSMLSGYSRRARRSRHAQDLSAEVSMPSHTHTHTHSLSFSLSDIVHRGCADTRRMRSGRRQVTPSHHSLVMSSTLLESHHSRTHALTHALTHSLLPAPDVAFARPAKLKPLLRRYAVDQLQHESVAAVILGHGEGKGRDPLCISLSLSPVS
jgi:hypothetical protein